MNIMTHKTKQDLQKLFTMANDSTYLKSITDKQWQKLFCEIRNQTEPTPFKRLTAMKTNPTIVKHSWWLTDNEKQDSQYAHYRNYINDVLSQIRIGKHDFCYHVYQVAELLRFHPDRLKTRLVDNYIEVWLEK